MTTIISKTAALAAFLSWGDRYRLPFGDLPDTTIRALAQRGFTHILGNEVAAYESGLKTAKDESGNAKYSAEEIAVLVHDRRMEKLDEMTKGELGTRTVGPRLPADVQIMRTFAKNAIIAAFAQHPNAKAPKASDSKAWGDYIDQYLAVPANADKAKKEADRQLGLAAKSSADGLEFLNSVLKVA